MSGQEEEPCGHLTAAERQQLDAISEEFGVDSRQQGKMVASAKRQGIAFVLDQADIVRNKPGIKNLAGAFERALETPGGWKRPKRSPKVERKVKVLTQQPEPSAQPEEDFSAELTFWQEASQEQRAVWFSDPAFAVMKKPKDNEKPSRMFLQILRFVLEQKEEKAA